MLCIETFRSTTRNAQTLGVLCVGATEKWWPKWKPMFPELGMASFEWLTKSKAFAIKWWRSEAKTNDLLRQRLVHAAEVRVQERNAKLATCGICSVLSRIRARC